MLLKAGSRLGSYEIQALIGAGGMGEVYRAHDPKLDRLVAIKVLARHLMDSNTAMARFEREVRAVAALSHPNVLSIFDFGEQDGLAYAVMELLEGQSLRELIQDQALPLRRALEIAGFMAEGLAAAHGKGIIHRDLKPENVFLTADGQVKLLDFGLAKHLPSGPSPIQPGSDETRAYADLSLTGTGMVMGTTRYMSPEQVRGQGADARSDIFAFGVVLWEMLTGAPPFKGDEVVDTLQAILKSDPPEILEPLRVPPTVERILRHCLNKRPEDRFQSAKDLAFQLQNVSPSGHLSGSEGIRAVELSEKPTKHRFGWREGALAAALVALVAGGFALRTWTQSRPTPPSFQNLWYQSGNIRSARLAPDGKTMVVGISLGEEPETFYLCSTANSNAVLRKLPIEPGSLVRSISLKNELALILPKDNVLAVLPLEGNALPREIVANVVDADWDPRTGELAILRYPHKQGSEKVPKYRLEQPLGTVRYESPEVILGLRFSPQGNQLALIEGMDPRARILRVLEDKDRAPREVLRFPTVEDALPDIEWSPDGKELFFRRLDSKGCNLMAVDLQGHERLLHRNAGSILLRGRSKDGRYLLEGRSWVISHRGLLPGRTQEEDLLWLRGCIWDFGTGDTVLVKTAEGGSALHYLGRDQRLVLSTTTPENLSTDGQWMLGHAKTNDGFQVRLVPTGSGQEQAISSRELGIECPNPSYGYGVVVPERKRLIVSATGTSAGYQLYVYDLEKKQGRCWKPEGEGLYLSNIFAVSWDGQRLATLNTADGMLLVFNIEDGKLLQKVGPIATGRSSQPIPLAWSKDDSELLIWQMEEGNRGAQVLQLNLNTQKIRPMRTIMPHLGPDGRIAEFTASRDGRSYAYTYQHRGPSTLLMADGLR